MVLETIKGKLNLPIEENTNPEECIIPEEEYRDVMLEVARSIEMGGYNPILQIVGFLLSEDPTHIANYGNARSIIGKIDRDTLLCDMVKYYIRKTENEDN